MSQALDHADLIRTRLLTPPGAGDLPTAIDLRRVPVIVDRQKDIVAEVTKTVAGTTGCAIVILWNGWTVVDKNARTPRLAHAYKLTVVTRPVMSAACLPADEIMEAALLRLWQWQPTGGHSHGEARVGDGSMLRDDTFLIYECDLVIPTSL